MCGHLHVLVHMKMMSIRHGCAQQYGSSCGAPHQAAADDNNKKAWNMYALLLQEALVQYLWERNGAP